jgi:hypothetical protein
MPPAASWVQLSSGVQIVTYMSLTLRVLTQCLFFQRALHVFRWSDIEFMDSTQVQDIFPPL